MGDCKSDLPQSGAERSFFTEAQRSPPMIIIKRVETCSGMAQAGRPGKRKPPAGSRIEPFRHWLGRPLPIIPSGRVRRSSGATRPAEQETVFASSGSSIWRSQAPPDRTGPLRLNGSGKIDVLKKLISG